MSAAGGPSRPIPNSYWVREGRFAAGEYPGALDPRDAAAKVRTLIEAGVRVLTNDPFLGCPLVCLGTPIPSGPTETAVADFGYRRPSLAGMGCPHIGGLVSAGPLSGASGDQGEEEWVCRSTWSCWMLITPLRRGSGTMRWGGWLRVLTGLRGLWG